MDGLCPVFNEGSRYLHLRYVSFPPFIDDGKLTTAEFGPKPHLIDELLSRFFKFNLTMKSDLSLGSCTSCSSISFGPPLSDLWILHSKDPLPSHIDSRLDQSFQILAATWLIEQSIIEDAIHGDNIPGLHYAQSVAGSKLLQCLEKTLSSSSLSKLGADKLTALTTILFYTVRRHLFKKKISLIASKSSVLAY